MSRTIITSLLAVGLAVAVSGCSSDIADDPPVSTTTSAATSGDASAATTVVGEDETAAFCATNDEIDALFRDAEEPQALIDAANEALALTPQLVAEAPEELAADVEILVSATEAVAAGDPSGFATVEFRDATAAVDELCGV